MQREKLGDVVQYSKQEETVAGNNGESGGRIADSGHILKVNKIC